MTKPATMHLISDIPDPAAYGAKDFTRNADTNASAVYNLSVSMSWVQHGEQTYRNANVDKVIEGLEPRPSMPLGTICAIVSRLVYRSG